MTSFYRIDGRWNDDGSEFSGMLMCESHDTLDGEDGEPVFDDCEYSDEDVFFYGMSRSEAEEEIGVRGSEFTITAVYDD